MVDPRYRVLESSRIPTSPGGRGDNNDPRFNNRQPGSQRFIYTENLAVSSEEEQPAASSRPSPSEISLCVFMSVSFVLPKRIGKNL